MATADDAAALARRHYALDCVAEPLDGEHDLNFRLTGDGRRYVLKFHRDAGDSRPLDLQDRILDRLATDAPALAAPGLIRTGDGRPRV
ncbi:MAG: aminoglycoside phosphotransferase, partial [Proteobacteria bacterium]